MRRISLGYLTAGLFISLLFASSAWAESSGPFWQQQTTRMSGYLANYSGVEEQSLTGKSGFGGEITTERGWRWFSIMGKVTGEYSATSADFNDGGTTRELDYQLLMSEIHIGARMGLFPTKRFNPYVSATALGGLVNLKFSNTDNLTELQGSQTSFAAGYTVSAGVELRLGDQNKKFLLWGEIQSRVSQAPLADESSFKLDALKLVGGIGW